MNSLKDVAPGPSKLAQFLALSSSGSTSAAPPIVSDDDGEAIEYAPENEAQPQPAGLAARISRRLSGRRSASASVASNHSDGPAPSTTDAAPRRRSSGKSRGLVSRLSQRWSDERRAERAASPRTSASAQQQPPAGLVRRMSRAWSGEAPLLPTDADPVDDSIDERINGKRSSRRSSGSGSRPGVAGLVRGLSQRWSNDRRADRDTVHTSAPKPSAAGGLVRRMSRAWSGAAPLNAADDDDDFEGGRGRGDDKVEEEEDLKHNAEPVVQRGMVRRLSQQWAAGALREAVLGADEDGPKEEGDDEEDQEEAKRKSTPPVPPVRRARKSIADLISLWGEPGAANAKSKPSAAPERPSLTRLQQRTLDRKSRQQAKPIRLPPNVTPHEEFKLSLGPRRARRGTNEASSDGEGHDSDDNEPDDDEVNDANEDDAGDEEAADNDDNEDDDATEARSQGDAKPDRRSRMLAKLDRIRSMNLSPDCPVCDKVVYRMEKLSDSRDRPFHYYCLKCEDCPKSLVGQVVHVMEEQGRSGHRMVLCAVHLHARQQSGAPRVKGWAPDTSFVNEGGKHADDPAAARKAVRRTLERSTGRKPLCSRCGGEILLSDTKNLVVSGMERLHLQCPDPSEIRHTPRHFVLATHERVPVLFAADARGKKGHSFLFTLESQEHKAEALERHRLEPVRLRYVPEEEARSSVVKQIRCDNQHFAVFDRRRLFSETEHPVTGARGFTRYDADSGTVLAQLYRQDAGCVLGMSAAFAYEYDERSGEATVEALSLELTFEVMDVKDFTGAEQEIAKVRAKSLRLHKAEAAEAADGAKEAGGREVGRKKKHRFSLRLEDDFCERMLRARR